jgi:hypothetical protein
MGEKGAERGLTLIACVAAIFCPLDTVFAGETLFIGISCNGLCQV